MSEKTAEELITYLHNIYKVTIKNPYPKDNDISEFVGKILKEDILDNIDGIDLNQTQSNIRFSTQPDQGLLRHNLYYGYFFTLLPMFTGELTIYVHILPKSYSYVNDDGLFLYKTDDFSGNEITITKTEEYEVKTGDFGLSAQFTQKELIYPDYPSDETINKATSTEEEEGDIFYQVINHPHNLITANDGDDVTYSIFLYDMYDNPIENETIEFFNEDEYLGSANTNSDGEANINLEKIDIGIYSLTGRYTNVSSFIHRLIVIETPAEYPDESLIGEYDSIVYLKVKNNLTNKILEEVKVIANNENIPGEKILLENFPFQKYDTVLRQDYLNCEFYIGNTKLKHDIINQNGILVPIIEIPYQLFRSKINHITCIIRDIDTIIQPDLSMYDYYNNNDDIYEIGNKNYRDVIQVSELPENALQLLTNENGDETENILQFKNTELHINQKIDSYNSIIAFSLKRFYSNYEDKYAVKYYPDFLYDKNNKGESTNIVYEKNDYLKFKNSNVSLLISMQNILQTKYEIIFEDFDYEENLFKNIIVNFKVENNLTIQQIQSIIPEYVWNNIPGEKVIIKNYPFSDVNQYFNTEKNNMRMIIDGTECDYIYFNKDEYEFYILQIPYDKIIPKEIKVKSIIYLDKSKSYGNNYNILKHCYDLNNGYGEESTDTVKVDFKILSETDDIPLDNTYIVIYDSVSWKYDKNKRTDSQGYASFDDVIKNNSYEVYIKHDEQLYGPIYHDAYFGKEITESIELTIKLNDVSESNNFTIEEKSIQNIMNINDNELINTDHNKALRINSSAPFKINDYEYRDIISIENNINNTSTYKSFLNSTNAENNILINNTITLGRNTNETGIYIIPTPDSSLNATLNQNSIYTQIEDIWTMTRLMMLRQERWVQYQPDYIFDIDNFGKKTGYSYNDVDYLNYKGRYDISLLVAMQNPIQVKFKQQWKDNYYTVEYPDDTVIETGDIPEKRRFQHYNMVGTRQTVNSIAAQTLTDLTFTSGYYRGTMRTNPQTCYKTVYDTICPGTGIVSGSAPLPTMGAYGTWSFNIPSTGNFEGYTVGVSVNNLSFQATANYNGTIMTVTLNGVTEYYNLGTSWATYTYPHVWVGPGVVTFKQEGSYGSTFLQGISANVSFGCYQKPRQESYDCSTYYTNANFRSANNLIESNTAELVIENNNQTISRVTMYSSANANLGNLLANINTKYATINNRAGQSCNFELVYSQYNVNLFSALFMKNLYAEDLLDIGYEFEIKGQNNLTQTQVTTAINSDNTNRNIYSRKVIINIPWDNKKLKGLIREDKKNIRFILKENNILLNHYISGENIYIEIPDKNLKATEMTINTIILPLNYQYDGRAAVYSIPTSMNFSNIEYNFY